MLVLESAKPRLAEATQVAPVAALEQDAAIQETLVQHDTAIVTVADNRNIQASKFNLLFIGYDGLWRRKIIRETRIAYWVA